jgi:hypothetical protein
VAWLDAECPIPGSWDWLPEEHELFWKDAGQPAEHRLVWLSSNSAHEVAGYLAYLSRHSELPAEVVRPNQYIPLHPTYGPLLGTGSANVEQLANVLRHAKRNSVGDDRAWFGRWVELESENAHLRIMDGAELVSAPVETYDRLLLGAAKTDWQKGVLLVGNALAATFDEQVRVSSDFLFSRLGALVRLGQLEAQGDVQGWEENMRRTPALVRKPA